MQNNKIKITESPRESFQACNHFLSADAKVNYIKILLNVGFDTIDVGSLVSPKAVPQLSDTQEVLNKLKTSDTKTKLLVSVGNFRGAENAMMFDQVNYIGFLYSVSPTFLKFNINSTPDEALVTIERINDLCEKNNKIQVVNLCLAFGNPYGDKYQPENVLDEVKKLQKIGITNIVLADTLACGDESTIGNVFNLCINQFPEINFGFHLHTDILTWDKKVEAAYNAGCRNFDSVILGLGGCPMSGKEMISNLSTENLISFCEKNNIETDININYLKKAIFKAHEIF